MVKFQFYKPVSSFAPATHAKQVTRSTVLRPVRSFCELTGAKGYTKLIKTFFPKIFLVMDIYFLVVVHSYREQLKGENAAVFPE